MKHHDAVVFRKFGTATGRTFPTFHEVECDCVNCLLVLEMNDELIVGVLTKLRRRAGVKNWKIPVFVVDHGMIPPTLRARWRNSHQREVVVSVDWLQKKGLTLWVQLVKARLQRGRPILASYRKERNHGSRDLRLVPDVRPSSGRPR